MAAVSPIVAVDEIIQGHYQLAVLTNVEILKLGEHQSFVSKYESGERRLDVIQLRRVCMALDIPLATFVERLEARLRNELR